MTNGEGETALTPPAVEEDRPLGGLVKHSAIYSAAPIIRQLISIGMHRLYTGWLLEAGMGVKEIVDFWVIALQQLLGANALGAMVRFYYDQKDEEDRARVVTSCTLLITLAAWLVCGTAFVFSPQLAPLMLGGGGEVSAYALLQIVQLALILIPFQLSTLSGFYYLQALKRSGLFTKIQTAKLLFEVGLNFVLIGYFGLGVRGFLLSILAGEALTSLFLCGWMLRKLKPRIDWRVMRPILIYAGPLIPIGLCQLVLHFVDRRLLISLEGQDMTGVYGHGYKIGFLVTNMVLGPFVQIWHPWIFGVENEDERGRLVARVSTYAVLTVAVASLGVIALGKQAARLLGATEPFWQAYEIIPFIASGYVFWALYHVSQMPLLIAKRTGRLFAINFAAVIVNVGLNLWLIPMLGISGAALATLGTFAFLSTLVMIVSHSYAHVPFELSRLVGILACVLLGGVFALWVDTLDWNDELSQVSAIAAKLAVSALIVGLFYFSILQREERASFVAWITARTRRSSDR